MAFLFALFAAVGALALAAQAAHPARSAAYISNGCDENGCEEPEGPSSGGDPLGGDSGGWAYEDSSSDGHDAGTPDNYRGDDLIQDEHGSGDVADATSADDGDYQGYEDTDERLDADRNPQPQPQPKDPWPPKKDDPFSGPHPTREQQEARWQQENCTRIMDRSRQLSDEGPSLDDRLMHPLLSKRQIEERLQERLAKAWDSGECSSVVLDSSRRRRTHRHH